MNRKTLRLIVLIFWLPIIGMGCAGNQLEKVAKDWAMLIRSSQMIPVYPPSEDLQPGDVLLVSTPVAAQVTAYQKKGFLPLDQLLVRLFAVQELKEYYGNDFRDFYNSRYGLDDDTIPPKKWQDLNNWENTPHVSFPAFNFSVTTGSGLNLAFPIQSIPFALGLIRSGGATGTMTISDAHTYGLDNYRLERIVRKWMEQDYNQKLLNQYEHCFLRVVSRVYLAGKVDVTVTTSQTTGGSAGAGDETPASLMGIGSNSTAENYQATLNALNNLVKSQLGAGVKVVTATSRSVTLNETFNKPLVIGYIGFDMQIVKQKTGNEPSVESMTAGVPISTLSQLEP
jgi:hypothetical protein